MRRSITLFLTFLALSASALAQDPQQAEMADLMRSNGKIYVVVAIICLVFLGITGYLIRLDRKVQQLEKQINKGL